MPSDAEFGADDPWAHHGAMPTVTVSTGLLETLGLKLADVQELEADAARALEPLLASRGFNTRSVIHVSALAADEGFLLTQ